MNKKKKKGFIRRWFGGFFGFRTWMNFDSVAKNADNIVDRAKKMFVISKPVQKSTSFDMEMEIRGITEQDLENRKKEFTRLYQMFFLFAVLMFFYMIYVLVQGYFLATMISLGLIAFFFAMAFKFHFWAFQAKERKLGCSLQEWFYYGLLGKRR